MDVAEYAESDQNWNTIEEVVRIAKEIGATPAQVALSWIGNQPSVSYADYFIAPNLLHWESQSTTSVASATGQRLTKGVGRHLFFVREDKDDEGRAAPFLCIGFGRPVSSEGEKPIRITWALEHSVPDHLYVRLRAAAG